MAIPWTRSNYPQNDFMSIQGEMSASWAQHFKMTLDLAKFYRMPINFDNKGIAAWPPQSIHVKLAYITETF